MFLNIRYFIRLYEIKESHLSYYQIKDVTFSLDLLLLSSILLTYCCKIIV